MIVLTEAARTELPVAIEKSPGSEGRVLRLVVSGIGGCGQSPSMAMGFDEEREGDYSEVCDGFTFVMTSADRRAAGLLARIEVDFCERRGFLVRAQTPPRRARR